jgi:hypothetical protein
MPGRCAAERNLRIGPISAYSSTYFLENGDTGNFLPRAPLAGRTYLNPPFAEPVMISPINVFTKTTKLLTPT